MHIVLSPFQTTPPFVMHFIWSFGTVVNGCFNFFGPLSRIWFSLKVNKRFSTGMILLASPCIKLFNSAMIKIEILALEVCMQCVFFFLVQMVTVRRLWVFVKARDDEWGGDLGFVYSILCR
jgi:hypothetical protein